METKINSKNWKEIAIEMVKGTRTATASERFPLSKDTLIWANKKRTSGIYQKGNVICIVRDFAPHFYTKVEAKKVVTAPTAEEIKARQEAYKAEVEARKFQSKPQAKTKKIENAVPKSKCVSKIDEVEVIVGKMEMGTFESEDSNYLSPTEKEAKRIFEARQTARRTKEEATRASESDADKFVRMCDKIVSRFDSMQKATGYSGVQDNVKYAVKIMFEMFPA